MYEKVFLKLIKYEKLCSKIKLRKNVEEVYVIAKS